MEADQIMQDIFAIARKLDEIKIFHNIFPFNNTEMQLMKVIVLAEEDGKRVISSEIARSLGVTRSAVSQMVKKLEEQKVVMRLPAGNDKKSAHVVLTPGARSAYVRIKTYMNAFVQQIVERVGYEEISNFIGGMNKFIDIFNEVSANFPLIDTTELIKEVGGENAAE